MPAFSRIVCVALLCSTLLTGCPSTEHKAEKFYREGLRFKNRGDAIQACKQFRKTILHNPRHVNAYLELGEFLSRDGNYAEAIKHFLRAIEYGATSSQPYRAVGQAYEQLGDLRLAEQYYQQAISRDVTLLEVRLHLADMLESQGRWPEAAKLLDEVLTINPDRADDMVIKARIALLRQPPGPDVYRALADVYISAGEFQKGFEAYQKFAPLERDNPATVARFGVFCAERGQVQRAANYLEKAIELGLIDQPEFLEALGKIYEQLGQARKAVKMYRMVLQLQPASPNIRAKLVKLLEQTGQSAEAADVLEELFYTGQPADVNALWSQILRLRGEDSQKAIVQLKQTGQFALIDLLVNNLAPATVILDPQAQYTIISEDLAQQLNILLSTRTSAVFFAFNGRRFQAPLINLTSIKIGGLEARNIPSLIWDLSEYPEIEGVLGKSFLKYFQVEVNDHDHLLILTKAHL